MVQGRPVLPHQRRPGRLGNLCRSDELLNSSARRLVAPPGRPLTGAHSARCPAVTDVGRTLLVAGPIGLLGHDNAVPLIEVAGPVVGSEGPEFEALG